MCRVLILAYLWGISFHAAIVFALGKNLLFESVLAHCVERANQISAQVETALRESALRED